jgi:Tol biopolymer transport system component
VRSAEEASDEEGSMDAWIAGLRWVAPIVLCGVAACGGKLLDSETIQSTAEGIACLPAATTTRLSVSSSGVQGDQNSLEPTLSADGRFVAFDSDSTNLVGADGNAKTDVFLRDILTGVTSRISAGVGGVQSNGRSAGPKISADGRFVSFASDATNLVEGDTNGATDIFVRDLAAGQTTRVSVGTGGAQASGISIESAISGDGRFVAFTSLGPLVADDTNGQFDVFLRDRSTGQTTRASVTSGGSECRGGASSSPAITPDGRFVAFASTCTNLVRNDTNQDQDVFVRDMSTGITNRVNVTSDGAEANIGASSPSISADGRFIAFSSFATNLVPGDTNLQEDVFVRDRRDAQTTRVSIGAGGVEGNGFSSNPTISADGRFVLYISDASNLVPNDTNGAVDLFLFDRTTGQTTRVDVSTNGAQADNRPILTSAISADDRLIVFDSVATNLVAGDTNDAADVFARDPRKTRAWVAGLSLQAGELVTFGGAVYEVLQSHTSQVGWEPTVAASLFRRPTPCGLAPWAVNTFYVVGSRVTFNGATFRAVQAHTSQAGWEPPAVPSLWQPAF